MWFRDSPHACKTQETCTTQEKKTHKEPKTPKPCPCGKHVNNFQPKQHNES